MYEWEGKEVKGEKESRKERKTFFFFRMLNLGGHVKQHGGCEIRQLNPATDQQPTSLDAGQTNPTGQRPGSNGSVGKLLQFIF